jgi:hypothetical protein
MDRSWALREIAEAMAKGVNLTLPSKSLRKLKTHRFVLGRLLKSLLRWQKQGKRKGLIKPSNSPFKSPRRLKTHRIVLRCLQASPIAMAEASQFDLALQIAQKIEDASDRSLALAEIAEAMAEAEGNLTLPSKSPRKLKTHGSFLGAC